MGDANIYILENNLGENLALLNFAIQNLKGYWVFAI